MAYSVEISNCDDSTADAVFIVRPPIEFVNEEARRQFGRSVLNIVGRRMGPNDIEGGMIEVTHNFDDRSASVGYANLPGLKYGSGKKILEQALLVALNGSL